MAFARMTDAGCTWSEAYLDNCHPEHPPCHSERSEEPRGGALSCNGEGSTVDIRGILLDSGGTLVFPKGGSWWPGPEFYPILQKHGVAASEISPQLMNTALDTAEKYFTNRLISDLEEERQEFRGYYRVLCQNLGFVKATDELIDDLACAYVDGCSLELYPDTVDTLDRLTKEGIILGVLSDAWPSLETKYATLGIRHYFRSFTISARVGCFKPCGQMYHTAIAEIGIEKGSLLFVDDDPGDVRAAIQLGMKGAVILRDRETVAGDIPVIRDLRDIFDLI